MILSSSAVSASNRSSDTNNNKPISRKTVFSCEKKNVCVVSEYSSGVCRVIYRSARRRSVRRETGKPTRPSPRSPPSTRSVIRFGRLMLLIDWDGFRCIVFEDQTRKTSLKLLAYLSHETRDDGVVSRAEQRHQFHVLNNVPNNANGWSKTNTSSNTIVRPLSPPRYVVYHFGDSEAHCEQRVRRCNVVAVAVARRVVARAIRRHQHRSAPFAIVIKTTTTKQTKRHSQSRFVVRSFVRTAAPLRRRAPMRDQASAKCRQSPSPKRSIRNIHTEPTICSTVGNGAASCVLSDGQSTMQNVIVTQKQQPKQQKEHRILGSFGDFS